MDNDTDFPILSWRRIIIDGITTQYIISDKGFVMNDSTGEFMLVANDKDGYPTVKLFVNGIGRVYKVHRLCCDAFNSNPFKYTEVDHINRNHWDSSKENLEFVTGTENHLRLQKMREIEKYQLGNYKEIRKNRTQYTDSQILQVCIRLMKHQAVSIISKKVSVDPRTIYLIKDGKIWKHISCYFSFSYNDGMLDKIDYSSIIEYIDRGYSNDEILAKLGIKYPEYFRAIIESIRSNLI